VRHIDDCISRAIPITLSWIKERYFTQDIMLVQGVEDAVKVGVGLCNVIRHHALRSHGWRCTARSSDSHRDAMKSAARPSLTGSIPEVKRNFPGLKREASCL
jgi:hypothetical protein